MTDPTLQKYFRIFNAIFYKAIFFLSAIYVLSLLFNYDILWMHPEVPGRDIPNAMSNGNAFILDDLLRGFDCWKFDGVSRSRFISYLFQICNIKFRIWLWNYLPPHPSFSLTWILSLILSPLLLFKLIYNLSGSRNAAWAALSLYILSTGYLSGIFLLFHPAKPLANFFVILCLFLASRINCLSKEKKRFTVKYKGAYLLLLGTLFLAFFTDEAAWYIFIFIPILFPAIFSPVKKKVPTIVLYCATFILFLLFVTFGAPLITKHLGFGEFNFWGYSVQDNAISENFKIINVFHHGINFLSDHINPFCWGDRGSILSYGVISFFLIYCIYIYLLLPVSQKKLMLRAFIALLTFLVFQTLILTRWLILIPSSYYYGSLFASIFTVFLSILFIADREPARSINKFILIIICVISASNSMKKNRMDLHFHETQSWGYPAWFPQEADQKKGIALTFPMIREAWDKRNDRIALLQLKPRFPLRAIWLFREFEYLHSNSMLKLVNPSHTPPPSPFPDKNNLLSADNIVVSCASQIEPGGKVAHLIDRDPNTIWHVSLDKVGESTWVIVDFGAEAEKRVKTLAARPRMDIPRQFFQRAELWGSNNGLQWDLIAPIIQETAPESGAWKSWEFDNTRPFRYYKLSILTGHEDGAKQNFFSISELEMYE